MSSAARSPVTVTSNSSLHCHPFFLMCSAKAELGPGEPTGIDIFAHTWTDFARNKNIRRLPANKGNRRGLTKISKISVGRPSTGMHSNIQLRNGGSHRSDRTYIQHWLAPLCVYVPHQLVLSPRRIIADVEFGSHPLDPEVDPMSEDCAPYLVHELIVVKGPG